MWLGSTPREACGQTITGPANGVPGHWSTYQYQPQSPTAANSAAWPAACFWRVTGADSVAGIARADLLNDYSFQSLAPTIRVRWAAAATDGLVEVRLGQPAESTVLVARAVALGPKGSDPDIVIVGPDTVEGGGAPVLYQIEGLAKWSDDYFWRVEGADSIQGVPLGDYLADSSFRTAGPEVIVHWSAQADDGTITVFESRPGDQGGDVVVAKLKIKIPKELNCKHQNDYRIKADIFNGNLNQQASTERSGQLIVCPDETYALGVNLKNAYQRWRVIYYTENGDSYTEGWRERYHRDPFTNKYAPLCKVTWYAYTPCTAAVSTTFPNDNSTFQPHYEGENWSGCVSVGSRRIVWARLESQTENARTGFLCFPRNLTTTLDVFYGVGPASNVQIAGILPLCSGNQYSVTATAAAHATSYEWELWNATDNTWVSRGSTSTPTWGFRAPSSSTDYALHVRVRPRRDNSSQWSPDPCDWIGRWEYTPQTAVAPITGKPTAMYLDVLPATIGNNNVLRVRPVAGATAYNWCMTDEDGNYFYTGLSRPSGQWDACSYTAQPFVPCRFPPTGRFRISVQAVGSSSGVCNNWGADFTQEFAVGGPATCPEAYNNVNTQVLPRTKPHDTDPLQTGRVWLESGKYNPAWSYAFQSNFSDIPLTHRKLDVSSSVFNPLTNEWTANLSWIGINLPEYHEYYIDMVVNTGNAQIICSYWYEDNSLRPGQPSGSTDGALTTRLMVYPNPATADELFVTASATGRCQWAKLYDQQGNLVSETRAENLTLSDHLTLPIRQLKPGLYTVRAFDGKRMVSALVNRQ